MTRSPMTMAPPQVPAHADANGDGIVVGRGPVRIDAYVDFLCPFCRQFEERSGPVLARLLEEGTIHLVYHPLGFLDRLSSTRYSSRAASASGCAADRDHFYTYLKALYARQPEEGGPGLSDDQLSDLGRAVGIHDAGFDDCVRAHRYLPWVEYVSALAVERGVSGTPSVFVQGAAVPANPITIAAAVADVAP